MKEKANCSSSEQPKPVPLHNTCHMHCSKTDLRTRKREVGDWPTELYHDHCIIILDSSRSQHSAYYVDRRRRSVVKGGAI